jgi:hypothetical protein
VEADEEPEKARGTSTWAERLEGAAKDRGCSLRAGAALALGLDQRGCEGVSADVSAILNVCEVCFVPGREITFCCGEKD